MDFHQFHTTQLSFIQQHINNHKTNNQKQKLNKINFQNQQYVFIIIKIKQLTTHKKPNKYNHNNKKTIKNHTKTPNLNEPNSIYQSTTQTSNNQSTTNPQKNNFIITIKQSNFQYIKTSFPPTNKHNPPSSQ